MGGEDTKEELVFADEAFAFGRYRTCLIQVRRGELSPLHAEKLESYFRMARLEVKGAGLFIGLLEQTAGMPPLALRQRQQAAFKSTLGDARHHFALVVEGDSVSAHAQRTIMRGLFALSPRVKIAASVRDILPFGQQHTGIGQAELGAAIERVRSALKTRI